MVANSSATTCPIAMSESGSSAYTGRNLPRLSSFGCVALNQTGAYGGPSRTVEVRAGAMVRHRFDLRASRRWYDLTVTSAADPTFLRRFAGHVENGRVGVSDPALGS